MSEKKASKTTDGAPDAPKKKSPVMMIVIIVLAAISLVATFVAVKQVSAKSKSGTQKKHVEKGPILVLDEFLVNLEDDSGDHYLKVTVGLELNKEKGKTPETMKEEIPPIRDAILASMSTKHRDDLTAINGREKLKSEIKEKVNAALGEDDVQDVYFTNFVTQ